jgi:hypothetical protein
LKDRGRRPEALHRAVDAEQQLPQGLGDRPDALQGAAGAGDAEHDERARHDDERPADEAEHRHLLRHQARAVHQVAEDQPVAPPDDPARPEPERPVLDRGERVGDRGFGCARNLFLQGDDPKDRDDADEDERALEETGGHVPQRELFALSPDDWEDHDGGADVGDDEQQLQQCPEEDPVVLPDAGDVAGRVVEHRLEEDQRRDRRDECDEVEDAEDARPLLV